MRPIVTDRVVWSVALSVGLSVTLVSPAKTAEPMEIPFALWAARMGRRNNVLDRGPEVLRDVAMATIFGFVYGLYIGDTWRIRLNRPCAAVMQPYVKLLRPPVLYQTTNLQVICDL